MKERDLSVPVFNPAMLSGKTVAITGGGRGIGRAVLEAFVDCGATVLVHTGREGSPCAPLPANVQALQSDFGAPAGQQAFVEFVRQHTDTLDVLINNAGTMFGRFPFNELSELDYARIIELNQHSVIRITRELLPLLTRSGRSAIVSTSSISASTGGSPGSSIYSASKAFISTWTRAMARELAPQGIRINAVSPGVIDTDFHQRYSSREKLENTRLQIPLQRLGTAEDCAPSYVFLATDELSGYITGQVLEVNGGQR